MASASDAPGSAPGLESDPRVLAEQVKSLYAQLPFTMGGTTVGCIIIVMLVWGHASPLGLLVWLAAVLVHQAWRLVLLVRFRRRFEPDPRRESRPGSFFSSLAFSPDGKLLAIAAGGWVNRDKAFPPSGDGVIRVYDVATCKEQSALQGHRKLVSSVQFSPDGHTLVSGGEDGTVRLWEVATGRELHRFEGHRGPVTAVAFTPDGRAILSGSRDSTAWQRIETEEKVQRPQK